MGSRYSSTKQNKMLIPGILGYLVTSKYPNLPNVVLNTIKMKNQTMLLMATIVALLFFPDVNFAQAPNLGSASNLVLFTTTGAVGNTGTSQITGNVGANTGAITGFEPPTTLVGAIDSGNAVTMQYAIDVQSAYDQLFNTTPTSTSHAPAFGSNETVFAGVYAIAAAGSVAGDLTLDAQGDPNAVFIFKFGGAFNTSASTRIILINGALSSNVFWAAEGAITMAAATDMKGTLIANNGAISLGTGGTLDGRMFSTTGAATIDASTITVPAGASLPIQLLTFTGACEKQQVVLRWSTATETANSYFTVERSVAGINWQVVGTVAGNGTSSLQHNYMLTDKLSYTGTSLYRLKQTDINGNHKYGNIIAVKNCTNEGTNDLTISPNPSNGKFELSGGNIGEVHSIEIFNSEGKQVYAKPGLQSKFDLSGQAPGVYYLRAHLDSKEVNLRFVVGGQK